MEFPYTIKLSPEQEELAKAMFSNLQDAESGLYHLTQQVGHHRKSVWNTVREWVPGQLPEDCQASYDYRTGVITVLGLDPDSAEAKQRRNVRMNNHFERVLRSERMREHKQKATSQYFMGSEVSFEFIELIQPDSCYKWLMWPDPDGDSVGFEEVTKEEYDRGKVQD